MLLGRSEALISMASILFMIAGWLMWYVLNTKRARDIGKDPKVIQKITIGLMVWSFIIQLYDFMGESGWIPGL